MYFLISVILMQFFVLKFNVSVIVFAFIYLCITFLILKQLAFFKYYY